jgi:hypothetical protein
LGGIGILHEPAGAERTTAQFSFEAIQTAGKKHAVQQNVKPHRGGIG